MSLRTSIESCWQDARYGLRAARHDVLRLVLWNALTLVSHTGKIKPEAEMDRLKILPKH